MTPHRKQLWWYGPPAAFLGLATYNLLSYLGLYVEHTPTTVILLATIANVFFAAIWLHTVKHEKRSRQQYEQTKKQLQELDDEHDTYD